MRRIGTQELWLLLPLQQWRPLEEEIGSSMCQMETSGDAILVNTVRKSSRVEQTDV